ncbi:hypothetical protein HK102_000266 [Quaeritorhiza haematococci]|nr:hypothetical protein HK102_000265 [Quaeritorhiza haematococci]KAJ3091520.1 hypothetical protein HK102_000266 [Quaeritorhiza haematococci]
MDAFAHHPLYSSLLNLVSMRDEALGLFDEVERQQWTTKYTQVLDNLSSILPHLDPSQRVSQECVVVIALLLHQIQDTLASLPSTDELKTIVESFGDDFASESEEELETPKPRLQVAEQRAAPASLRAKKTAQKGKRTPAYTRPNYPEHVTNLLKKWLFDNQAEPYPSEQTKLRLCEQTGLNLTQMNNWFINARRRILKK